MQPGSLANILVLEKSAVFLSCAYCRHLFEKEAFSYRGLSNADILFCLILCSLPGLNECDRNNFLLGNVLPGQFHTSENSLMLKKICLISEEYYKDGETNMNKFHRAIILCPLLQALREIPSGSLTWPSG